MNPRLRFNLGAMAFVVLTAIGLVIFQKGPQAATLGTGGSPCTFGTPSPTPTVKIAGTVVYDNGENVTTGNVSLATAQTTLQTPTNQGKFSLMVPPNQTYQVSAVDGSGRQSNSVAVEVKTQEVSGLALTISRATVTGSKVFGYVTRGDTGARVNGIKVVHLPGRPTAINGNDAVTTGPTASVREDGYYEFPALTKGEHTFLAWSSGQPGNKDWSSPGLVTLAFDGNTKQQDFVISPVGQIRIKVGFKSGRSTTAWPRLSTTVTDTSGRYYTHGFALMRSIDEQIPKNEYLVSGIMPPGQYRIKVVAQPLGTNVSWTATGSFIVDDAGDTKEMIIDDTVAVGPVNRLLSFLVDHQIIAKAEAADGQECGRVYVKVLDAKDGKPLSRALIRVQSLVDYKNWDLYTDTNGLAKIENLLVKPDQDNAFQVTVREAAGYMVPTDEQMLNVNSTFISPANPVVLNRANGWSNQSRLNTVKLKKPVGEITGQLYDQNTHDPIVNKEAVLQLQSSDEKTLIASVTVNKRNIGDGSFTIKDIPIDADQPVNVFKLKLTQLGGAIATGKYAIEVPEDGTIDLRKSEEYKIKPSPLGVYIISAEASMKGLVYVGGRVKIPVENADIYVDGKKAATSDQDGQYEIKGLTAPSEPKVIVKHELFKNSERQPVIRPGVNEIDFRLDEKDPNKLSGRVTDSKGKPVGSAIISAKSGGKSVQSSVTDRDGNYEIKKIPQGTFEIKVSADGSMNTDRYYDLVGAPVTVRFAEPAGLAVEKNLKLKEQAATNRSLTIRTYAPQFSLGIDESPMVRGVVVEVYAGRYDSAYPNGKPDNVKPVRRGASPAVFQGLSDGDYFVNIVSDKYIIPRLIEKRSGGIIVPTNYAERNFTIAGSMTYVNIDLALKDGEVDDQANCANHPEYGYQEFRFCGDEAKIMEATAQYKTLWPALAGAVKRLQGKYGTDAPTHIIINSSRTSNAFYAHLFERDEIGKATQDGTFIRGDVIALTTTILKENSLDDAVHIITHEWGHAYDFRRGRRILYRSEFDDFTEVRSYGELYGDLFWRTVKDSAYDATLPRAGHPDGNTQETFASIFHSVTLHESMLRERTSKLPSRLQKIINALIDLTIAPLGS